MTLDHGGTRCTVVKGHFLLLLFWLLFQKNYDKIAKNFWRSFGNESVLTDVFAEFLDGAWPVR